MTINIHVEKPSGQLDVQIWASGIIPKWRCINRLYLSAGTKATRKDVRKKGRGPRTESWAEPSIRGQRQEGAVQCGRRRRWNCRSHVKKPSKEGGEGGTGWSNELRGRDREGQHGPSKKVTWKGQSGIELGVNYKLECFKKEWEEEKIKGKQ